MKQFSLIFVFHAKVVVDILVRCEEFVDIGLIERSSRKLDFVAAAKGSNLRVSK